MKLSNAIKKLEKAGYEIKENTGSYVAILDIVTISFFAQADECSKFTFDSDNQCAPTYGLSLTQAMKFGG